MTGQKRSDSRAVSLHEVRLLQPDTSPLQHDFSRGAGAASSVPRGEPRHACHASDPPLGPRWCVHRRPSMPITEGADAGCNTGTRVSGGRPSLARRGMRRVYGWATRSVAINSLPFCYISFHSDVNGVLGLPRIAWRPHVERHQEDVGLSRCPLRAGAWLEATGAGRPGVSSGTHWRRPCS